MASGTTSSPATVSVDGWTVRTSGKNVARFMTFEKDKWYHIRVQVTEKRIQAWIDEKNFVDVDTEGHQIGIRWEVDRSTPLGIATWRTGGAIRNVEFRTLTVVELEAAKANKDGKNTATEKPAEPKEKK